jgi:hypothetical protein
MMQSLSLPWNVGSPEKQAESTARKATGIKNAIEAINLFTGLLQLAASLAIVFA